MTTVILTTLGILIAAAAALMITFYGGDLFSSGTVGARANEIHNAGLNVVAGADLYMIQNRAAPPTYAALRDSGFIKGLGSVSIPNPQDAWVVVEWDGGYGMALVIPGIDVEECSAINALVNPASTVSIPSGAVKSAGCFEANGTNNYYIVVMPYIAASANVGALRIREYGDRVLASYTDYIAQYGAIPADPPTLNVDRTPVTSEIGAVSDVWRDLEGGRAVVVDGVSDETCRLINVAEGNGSVILTQPTGNAGCYFDGTRNSYYRYLGDLPVQTSFQFPDGTPYSSDIPFPSTNGDPTPWVMIFGSVPGTSTENGVAISGSRNVRDARWGQTVAIPQQYWADIDNGTMTAIFSAEMSGFSGDSDRGKIEIACQNDAGVPIGMVTTPLVDPATWTNIVAPLAMTPGCRSVLLSTWSQRVTGTENSIYYRNFKLRLDRAPSTIRSLLYMNGAELAGWPTLKGAFVARVTDGGGYPTTMGSCSCDENHAYQDIKLSPEQRLMTKTGTGLLTAKFVLSGYTNDFDDARVWIEAIADDGSVTTIIDTGIKVPSINGEIYAYNVQLPANIDRVRVNMFNNSDDASSNADGYLSRLHVYLSASPLLN